MTNIDALRRVAQPVTDDDASYDPLLGLIGDAPLVLIGEASHGTHEFYAQRARLTKRLIQEKGFAAVAVEADWPDAYRVNRYVRGEGDDAGPAEALGGFKARFPTWMWRNLDVLEFVAWLREFNDESDRKTGFYGLDLYSLFTSIDAVIRYLEETDPEAARRARYRYSCFDHYGEDSQAYGYAATFGMAKSCEDEVLKQLTDLVRRGATSDEAFYAQQNARLVRNAEEYYRSMFGGRVSSWNLRDRHMAETLDELIAHLSKSARAKIVVWEHNSHLGDARATEMGAEGELNVGQLVREKYASDAVLIGFSTYSGTVTAASDWDAPAELKHVRPALRESYEAVLHDVSSSPFYLTFRGEPTPAEQLAQARLERAIGVIYRPDSERVSHYFHAHLPSQFDAVLHFDETSAVEPMERTPAWHDGEAPETFPFAV